jgi:competence protein ComEC
LIGVGQGNDYGHPTAKLLGILAAVGTRPIRSDLDGMALIAPGARPGEIRVWTEKPEDPVRDGELTGSGAVVTPPATQSPTPVRGGG